jgi:hypothetical protein
MKFSEIADTVNLIRSGVSLRSSLSSDEEAQSLFDSVFTACL